MKTPQFSERQYEIAAHLELAKGAATSPFVPTQQIEAYVGFDAAVDPTNEHEIWRILSVHIPPRVHLSPALWPALPPLFHEDIPGKFCSLFIQFKRPIFQDGKRGKYRHHFGQPYFEVRFTTDQQKALLDLEHRVGEAAVVRYASPAFWASTEFELCFNQEQILTKSAYIGPALVNKHKKWMYSWASKNELLNPDQENIESNRWENVLGELLELTLQSPRQSLRDHIRSLAVAIGENRQPQVSSGVPLWVGRLAQYGHFSPEDNTFLMNLSIVSLTADSVNSAWFVLLLPDETWRGLI